jgi:hypothetical protein
MGVETADFKLFVLSGILVGSTPQVQIHSYVAMGQFSIALAVISLLKAESPSGRKKMLKCWLIYGIVANVLAIPQLPPYFSRVTKSRSSFLQFNPIWRTSQKKDLKYAPVILWWRGLGAFAAIALVFGWSCITKEQLTVWIPSLFVFVTTNLIRYQPWELDNTKLFYAAWIPVALPVVGQFLARLVTGSRRTWVRMLTSALFVLLLVACCLSAFMSSIRSYFRRTNIFEKKSYRFGLWLAENSPVSSVVMYDGRTNNPAATVGGRQLWVGYGGWISSHGLDTGRLAEQRRMYEHPEDTEMFRKNNISLVVLLKSWGKTFGGPKWGLLYTDDLYEVYRLL